MSRPSSPVRGPRRTRACRGRADGTPAPAGTSFAGPVAAGVLVLAGLSACTSAVTVPDTPTPEMGERTSSLQVSAPVTRVAGRLSDRDRLAVRTEVEALVAGYVTAAFLDPGTAPEEMFPGFTDAATRLARAQDAVLSRADLDPAPDAGSGAAADDGAAPDDGAASDDGGTATVEVVSVEAPVTVLAPRGRPAGATARLDLRLAVTPPPSDDGEAAATEDVRLRGRLLLTPVGQGWQVFGFDLIRTGR